MKKFNQNNICSSKLKRKYRSDNNSLTIFSNSKSERYLVWYRDENEYIRECSVHARTSDEAIEKFKIREPNVEVIYAERLEDSSGKFDFERYGEKIIAEQEKNRK